MRLSTDYALVSAEKMFWHDETFMLLNLFTNYQIQNICQKLPSFREAFLKNLKYTKGCIYVQISDENTRVGKEN